MSDLRIRIDRLKSIHSSLAGSLSPADIRKAANLDSDIKQLECEAQISEGKSPDCEDALDFGDSLMAPEIPSTAHILGESHGRE